MSLIYGRRCVDYLSQIGTKNYARLTPAGTCGHSPWETSFGRERDGSRERRGTYRVHGVVPRHESDRSSRESPEEYTSQAHCQPGTTVTKKDKRSTNGDNSCGIANEPSGHPNDGWLGGAEPRVFSGFDTSRENSTFWRAAFSAFPLAKGSLKYPRRCRFIGGTST